MLTDTFDGYRYTITYGTYTYELSTSDPIEVVSVEGVEVPAVTALTEQAPLQHGDTDIDFRLAPRVVLLTLQAPRNASYSYIELRALLNRIFKPSNTPIVLLITDPNGQQYQLNTRSISVQFADVLDQRLLLRAAVQLRAADPLFYDPIQSLIAYTFATAGGAFSIPSVVPTFFGGSTIDTQQAIVNAGTFKALPIIDIYGPITDPVIENVSTGLKLDFTGITINNGDYYTIDLRYGRKQVYKNGDTTDNRISELTIDSSLAIFAIEADPDVIDGNNIVYVTGTGGTNNTKIYIRYNTPYVGV